MEQRDENEDEVVRFEQLLVELDISVAEIAKLIGISSNAIYTMNSTKRGIPKKLLAALAKYESLKGHININWIITGMGPMFSPSESDVKAKLQADFMSLYHTMSGFQDIAEKLQQENAELREGFSLLANCYTTLKDDFSELRDRFEAIHGQTMRPPMYEHYEEKKREKLEFLTEKLESTKK